MNRQLILRVAFWAAAVFSLYMAGLPQPPQVPGTHGDKVQHILAFAVLAALGAAAYPKARLLLIWLGLSAFGAAIELYQTNPAISRDGSFGDWLADTLAAAVILLLVNRSRGRTAGSVGQKG